MRHYFVKILRHGDVVLSMANEQLVVRRANGEVEIFRFVIDENHVPRLDLESRITVTYGENTIEVVTSAPVGKKIQKKPKASGGHQETAVEDGEVIMGTF